MDINKLTELTQEAHDAGEIIPWFLFEYLAKSGHNIRPNQEEGKRYG